VALIPQTEKALSSRADTLLAEVGFTEPTKEEKNDISGILNTAGLTPEDAVSTLGELMRFSENDGVKKSCVDTVLKLHGYMEDKPDQTNNQINIVIHGSEGQGIVSVDSVLCPVRG